MKTYEQTTNNILQRVEALQAAKAKRNRRIISVATSLGCVAIVALLGNVIWLRGNHQPPPQPSESVVTNPNNDPASQDVPVVDVPASKEESKVENEILDNDEILNTNDEKLNYFTSIEDFEAFLKNGNAKTEKQKSILSLVKSADNCYYKPVLGNGNQELKLDTIALESYGIVYIYTLVDKSSSEEVMADISVFYAFDDTLIDSYNIDKLALDNKQEGYYSTTIRDIEYIYFEDNNKIRMVSWKQNDGYHMADFPNNNLSAKQALPLIELVKVELT